MTRGNRRSPVRLLAIGATLALAAAAMPPIAGHAQAMPAGFTETTVFSGMTTPTNLVFSPDGRIFVAEKSGIIKVFDNVSDTTPTIFANLGPNVHDYWDRGLLGLAVPPNFPTSPFVYVLYTYDHILGDPLGPKWNDGCPSPPGPTADGCVVSGRLSRLQAAGNVMTGSEQVLIEDWCNQYPSHSIGDLRFGADGMLYVSAGDGASFTFNDYGQDGNPINPCGDPPGGTMSLPTAEGGALRSQDIRTSADPQGFDGTILRLDPATGLAAAGNPLIGNSDPNVRRVIATGFRNPFRTTFRPGTNELWAGDVGQGSWEEINRVQWSLGMRNHGWPCYEGAGRMGGFDGLNVNICENLYAAGSSAVAAPYFAYAHNQPVAGESCGNGGSSTSGLAFYTGTSYPTQYLDALFFADYSRDCIWVMLKGANGLPDTGNIQPFLTPAANPVDLEIGPNGDLFYVDFDGGRVQRISFSGGNQAPTAVATAVPTSGPVPLQVAFSATSSTDPNGDTLSYAWDLDGDGAYDDSTSATPSFTYTTPGTITVGLRATDPGGLNDTDTVSISATNQGEVVSYLSDRTPTTAINGYGPYERDMSNGEDQLGDGNPIRLGTTTYTKGLGVHAASDLRYALGGACSTFVADIGLDEEVGVEGSVIFQVFADATQRFLSPAMTGTSATQGVNVSLAGAQQLRLVVQTNGSPDFDHADWANARISCGTGNQAPTAHATAVPTSGPVPLQVAFSATSSTDPNGDTLSYAWDLDGDGAYDDSTSATPSFTYTTPGTITVGLRATDPGGLNDTDTVSVSATSGGGSVSYLSDRTPTTAINGYGPYERDMSNGEDQLGDGNPIRLGTTTYTKGLGVHAASDLRYALPTGCTNFAADIGLDEEVGVDGSVIFQVFTDGTQRFLSPALTGTSATQSVSVDLTGRQQLQLVVQTNGSPDFDHADWANARISCGTGNQAPTALATANPTSGPAPLTVAFSGTGSSDPNGDTLVYAWDLDADGAYDDSSSATPSRTYTAAGSVIVGLRVTDPGGLSDTDTVTVTVGAPPVNELPVPTIDEPTADLTWAVDDVITFSGSATDAEDGDLGPASLTWTWIMHHCTTPTACHTHTIEQFVGVDGDTFKAPDHEYPSHLELRLTATDSDGGSASTSVEIQPKTVDLTFTSAPATGLQVIVQNVTSTTPFTRTVIVNGRFTATAITPQTIGSTQYDFSSWSDGGAQSHEITAPTTPATYTASYATAATVTTLPAADANIRSQQPTKNFGTASVLRVRSGQSRSYLRFVVSGVTGTVTSAKLRLRVVDAGPNGGRIYAVTGAWTETGITWNNAPVISGSPIATVGAATVATWKEVNLGTFVTGNGTYNLAISDGSNDAVDYRSRETVEDPQLVLTVTP